MSLISGSSAGDDPISLVQPPIPLGAGYWPDRLKAQKAFRIRGLSWFQENVQRDLRQLKPLIPALFREVQERPLWRRAFGKIDHFSIAQLVKASNHEPLLFEKAALSILLLEIAGREKDIPSRDIYEHISINPAVFYVSGFDLSVWTELPLRGPRILDRLQQETRQQDNHVFHDLAQGKTVSFDLATKVARVLQATGLVSGRVEIGFDDSRRRPKGASTEEVDPNEPWPNRKT
jgi:hypothetical protein